MKMRTFGIWGMLAALAASTAAAQPATRAERVDLSVLMRMVREAEKPSFRAASCCRVEVVKGGAGLRRAGLLSTVETV